jgi:hypothetical protein
MLRRFLAAGTCSCQNPGMQSSKTASLSTRRGEAQSRTRRGYQTVRISSGLIAFYPQAIHRPQPYVILLDPASGILKRLDLQSTK